MFGVSVQLLFFVLSSTLVHCNPGELVIDQDTQDHLDLSDTKDYGSDLIGLELLDLDQLEKDLRRRKNLISGIWHGVNPRFLMSQGTPYNQDELNQMDSIGRVGVKRAPSFPSHRDRKCGLGYTSCY
ncbi:uncharacterized protein LOC111715481 [Eurytemora carolleeae]|uniref:uncharacterized protein LOC111715481 n=1 Tax=Eurytemora carolleeae TaxID=1294199 RepID=UPI000C7724BD|nr:uncharacterized protein LOC111715481 [Eurytemora carolleeae]XP_023346578.1 uncharacterized protein LOC111715481 [Eurytemora carolleeae]XP_023346579.1 uncharacterized protein LOC111715481 [Eurytemora carolleeae]|eukprot:XP_023346577.1 uncharacterized protein LOC111715481 [Eurytemora affinis]